MADSIYKDNDSIKDMKLHLNKEYGKMIKSNKFDIMFGAREINHEQFKVDYSSSIDCDKVLARQAVAELLKCIVDDDVNMYATVLA